MLSNVSREAAFSVAERIRFHLENKQFYVDPEGKEVSTFNQRQDLQVEK